MPLKPYVLVVGLWARSPEFEFSAVHVEIMIGRWNGTLYLQEL
jgi:hypothetical protein